MISSQQAEAANDFLRDKANEYAMAKANRIYLDAFRKSKQAMLYQQAPDGTVDSKNSYAYSHPEYLELLEGLKAAVEQEETLRWQMTAAQAKIEMWRSQESTRRAGI